MRFHPVVSIVFGVVMTFIFLFIGQAVLLSTQSSLYLVILLFGILFGGFLATYFAKEVKIRYSLYEGLIFGVLLQIIGYLGSNYMQSIQFNIFQVLLVILLPALISVIGGYIAKSWGKPVQKTLSLKKGKDKL